MDPTGLPRRTVLAASGAAVLAGAAACSPGSGSTPQNVPGQQDSTETQASQAAGQSPRSGASASGQSGSGVPLGLLVAAVTDIPDGSGLVVNGPDMPVLLGRKGDTVVAHTAVCTHQQCIIGSSGQCPCHGSAFDVMTGAVVHSPAVDPLATVEVHVANGQVYVR